LGRDFAAAAKFALGRQARELGVEKRPVR